MPTEIISIIKALTVFGMLLALDCIFKIFSQNGFTNAVKNAREIKQTDTLKSFSIFIKMHISSADQTGTKTNDAIIKLLQSSFSPYTLCIVNSSI